MTTRTVQQPRVAGLVDTRYDVIVNGVKVGEVVKNKHRIWWGHFSTDPAHSVATPPYIYVGMANKRNPAQIDAPLEFHVHPSRRKAEVVAAVVRAERGAYEAELRAATAKWAVEYAAKQAAKVGEVL